MDVTALLKTIPPWMLLFGGAALGWIKSFWDTVYSHTLGFVIRKLHVALSVEEQETEEAYVWLSLWAEKRIREKRITDLLLRRKDDKDGRSYQAVPHYGTYYLRFKKRYWLVFTSSKEGNTPDAQGGGGSRFFRPRRSIYIAIWGTLDRKIITDLLDEARQEFYAQLEKKLLLYRNESSWWEDRELSPRSLDTIYLPQETTKSIVSDIQQFLEIKDKYRMLGIPWRRGLLFFGPPGTGKSSLVQALATHLELPVYYLNLNAIDKPESLQYLINRVSGRSILLIEDVDCIPAARERKIDDDDDDDPSDSDGKKGIIASDLLNVIDGVVATEGRILILTTNHRDRLDGALLRKGRIDREFEITWAQDAELRRFHERAKDVFDLPEYDEFRAMLPEQTTIADAQALLFTKKKMVEPEGFEPPMLDERLGYGQLGRPVAPSTPHSATLATQDCRVPRSQ